MRMESFIRRALGLKAHRVIKIEEDEAARNLVVHLDRREHRRLHCGECGRGTVRIRSNTPAGACQWSPKESHSGSPIWGQGGDVTGSLAFRLAPLSWRQLAARARRVVICFLVASARKLGPVISTKWAPWVSRSRAAEASSASPNSSGHSDRSRLLVKIIDGEERRRAFAGGGCKYRWIGESESAIVEEISTSLDDFRAHPQDRRLTRSSDP